MFLCVAKGHLYLTPTVFEPTTDVLRSIDYSVLPQVEALLGNETRQHYKLMPGKNQIVFLFSQLMNGRCIRGELNAKSNKDIKYCVTEVVCMKDSAHSMKDRTHGGKHKSQNLPIGRRTFVRWGGAAVPRFESEEQAQKHISDTWVAAIYFEECLSAHDAMNNFASGEKSGAMIVTVEDASELGFLSYLYPGLAAEIKVIFGHKIFGRQGNLPDLKARKANVVTSRFLIVLKIDRFTGEYFQNGRFAASLADVKEAFLRGKRLVELYDRPEDIEVWCKIPEIIQNLEVEGVPFLGEVRLLDKALYGQCDAPCAWETTLWDNSEMVGLLQSLSDPSLWLYFANAFECGIMRKGDEMSTEYYCSKLKQLAAVPRDDLAGRVAILEEGSKPERLQHKEWARDTHLANPQSVRFCTELLPHEQFDHAPSGCFGVHVDDLLSGGDKMFHLRMFVLFDSFELGSFCILEEGRRDAYIGREVAVVPFLFDQKRVRAHLNDNSSHMIQGEVELPVGAVQEGTAEEVAAVEKRVGISSDTRPEQYPETTKISYDPMVVLSLHKMSTDVVYYVGQELYAEKITALTEEEVEKFYEKRRAANGNKWKLRECKSPFKGRLGELLWLKSNAIISQCVSELASLAHKADLCERYSDVDQFVDDLNGTIGAAQFKGSNTQRIYRLADLGNAFICGAADAGKERIGGTSFIAGAGVQRVNVISHWSKKPKRKFSSSTAIEVLGQKVLSAELIYLLQVVLDLHICTKGRPFAQIADSKNSIQEPAEKNIKPDYAAMSGLVRAKLLKFFHGPGKKLWVDALTKAFRDGHAWLLHIAVNLGLLDVAMMRLVQKHITEVLETEAKKTNMLTDEMAQQMEEAASSDDDELPPELQVKADQDDEELPQELEFCSVEAGVGTIAATIEMPVFKPIVNSAEYTLLAAADADWWSEDEYSVTKHHGKIRSNFFTPLSPQIPSADCWRFLTDRRTTRYELRDTGERHTVVDNWRGLNSHRPVTEQRLKWLGTTMFEKRKPYCGMGVLAGPTKWKILGPSIDQIAAIPVAELPPIIYAGSRTKEENTGKQWVTVENSSNNGESHTTANSGQQFTCCHSCRWKAIGWALLPQSSCHLFSISVGWWGKV
eukprot:g17566.t1